MRYVTFKLSPLIRGMFKLYFLKKNTFLKFFKGFIPSKRVLLAGIVFYIAGFLLAVLDPETAQLIFKGGFLWGNLEVKFQPPSKLTLNYLTEQFINYLGFKSFNIFLNNLLLIILAIFSGFALIPVVLIGLFSFTGSITYLLFLKLGVLKTFLVLLGSFHLYLELLAGILAIDAFILFYGSFIKSIREKSASNFKIAIKEKFIPLFLKITILLFFAAVLEVFWSTWWVYIITQQYISWLDFYLGVYSAWII
ncbi:MAG: hypothetical protein CIT01_05480 [Methanobacterium sp. BRmetb2]|nr:MAG: hypothetical protein CIT01_05480 [Methanobacterium sp. BRmetb2]